MDEFDGFVLSELLYVACLEALFSAYIVPLSNTIRLPLSSDRTSLHSHCSDYGVLLWTFGSDVIQLLSCHRAIINDLQMFKKKFRDDDKEEKEEGESVTLASRAISALRRGVPAMRAAYQKYAQSFNRNMEESFAAKACVPDKVWKCGYEYLARGTLMKSLLDFGVEERTLLLLSEECDVSFETLTTLPLRHVARYHVYTDNWIRIQHQAINVNTVCVNEDESRFITGAEETLKALIDVCSTVNSTRAALMRIEKLAELKRILNVTEISSQFLSEGDVVVSFRDQCMKKSMRSHCSRARLILLSDSLLLHLYEKEGPGRRRLEQIPLANIMSVRCARVASESSVLISYARTVKRQTWTKNKFCMAIVAVILPNETEALLWLTDITLAVSHLSSK